MNIYLLDTNQCSQIINKEPKILYKLNTLEQDDILATSVIVCGELMYMAENSSRRNENILIVRSFLENITVIDIDRKVFDTYALIKSKIFNRFAPKDKKKRRKYKFEKIGFPENDLWIAATGIAYNATIVSSDKDFKRMLDVIEFQLECWTNSKS